MLGGLGFIGSAVVLRLAEPGARVQVADALLDGFGGSRRNVPESIPNCDVHEVDVRDGGLEEVLAGMEVVVKAVVPPVPQPASNTRAGSGREGQNLSMRRPAC